MVAKRRFVFWLNISLTSSEIYLPYFWGKFVNSILLGNKGSSAACKPQLSQPFTILPINCKSKPDQNMTIPLFKIFIKASKQVFKD